MIATLNGVVTKFIQQAVGVGKRVAERVVVDLKDKVGLEGVDLQSTGLLQGAAGLVGDDAAQALIALGFLPQDVTIALQGVDGTLPTEQRVKLALQQVGGR
jgi:Holliday junction DNA helicase RuvA